MNDKDFFDGLKDDEDKTKEWIDSASALVGFRRRSQGDTEPLENVSREIPELREEGQPGTPPGSEKIAAIHDALKKAVNRRRELEKIAGVGDQLGKLMAHGHGVGASMPYIGLGILGGGLTMLGSIKSKGSDKSRAEVSAQKAMVEEMKKPIPTTIFGKLRRQAAGQRVEGARLVKEHPVLASLIAAYLSGRAGHAAAKMLGAAK